MKKLFSSLLLSVPLATFSMNVKDDDAVMKIPLEIKQGGNINRSFNPDVIICYYDAMLSCIRTTCLSDLGNISISVINYTTGEILNDIYDSAIYPLFFIDFSGAAGVYEIIYVTEAGQRYEGGFVIE
ncbi:MAG: hypothetical protein IJB06_05575 [Bacteroidales bacterium]|nr:hypothetical protein [Bacteroidales bacterium]